MATLRATTRPVLRRPRRKRTILLSMTLELVSFASLSWFSDYEGRFLARVIAMCSGFAAGVDGLWG